jgi:hypothetical protein
MPQFIDAASMLPIEPDQAPESLRSAVFPETAKTGPYDVLTKAPKGGCRDSPGPASPTLYCVQSTSPSWVAFRWCAVTFDVHATICITSLDRIDRSMLTCCVLVCFIYRYKFVDQPGLQQVKLTDMQKTFMQNRVEALHKMLPTATANWLKPGEAIERSGIAAVDFSAVVVPPAGMEHGYVPIALYEGIEKPPGCQAYPKPATPPPEPPPPPPPKCPPPPAAGGCAARCLAAGHCCVGTVSSYGTTSCGQVGMMMWQY